ncbi:MAG: DUF1365 family protein [Novosphingobium sp.]|nr:DUF1365 family protein [Novosphingobium sp.]
MTASCLYVGEVVHIRRQPTRHRLSYKVFMGLFDLDELASLARRNRLFGYNRAGLLSFNDRDHGDGSGGDLRPQVERALADAGISAPGGPIRILCMPRLMGYVFNPLSAFFCYDPEGDLRAIVHEVNNTFGERHFYALPVGAAQHGRIIQRCDKQFRVSPFLPLNLKYNFTITPPTDQTAVCIAVHDEDGQVLVAWFTGKRAPFTSWTLLKQWLRHPAMTLKVIAGIHWEALFLWLRLRKARKASRCPVKISRD